MASFNLTVEDSSPLISYSPAGSWTDTPAGDPLAASYSGSSLHTTATLGATATINFNGTGISIFGGNRPNYGTFSLIVDQQLVTTGTAESAIPSTRQLLGTVSGLINGVHTAVFANTNGQPIDIDSIEFQSQVGGPGSTVAPKTFDDSNPAITYLPSPSAWQITTDPTPFNGTLHSSQTPDASASLSFSGEAVALYGTVSPDSANLLIAIDGQSLNLPGGSGQVSAIHPQVLLYYQDNLVPGQHTLVLSGDPTLPAGPSIDLESITVFGATGVSAGMPSASTGSIAAGSSMQSKSLSTGTIIGAAVGGVVGLLLLLALLALAFFLLYRRRRRRDKLVRNSMIPVSPELPMQTDPKAMEAGFTDFAKPENTVFPFPPPTEAELAVTRLATPSLASETSAGLHSRDSSIISSASTTPLVTRVPVLRVPQPSVTRKPVAEILRPASSFSEISTGSDSRDGSVISLLSAPTPVPVLSAPSMARKPVALIARPATPSPASEISTGSHARDGSEMLSVSTPLVTLVPVPRVPQPGIVRKSVEDTGRPISSASGMFAGSHSRDGSMVSSASTISLVTPPPVLRVPSMARKPVVVTERSATPSSASETSGSHSRDGSVMSDTSPTPSVTFIPVLSIPRKPAPSSAGLVSILKKKDVRFVDANDDIPSRPSTRPPTMDFRDMDQGS